MVVHDGFASTDRDDASIVSWNTEFRSWYGKTFCEHPNVHYVPGRNPRVPSNILAELMLAIFPDKPGIVRVEWSHEKVLIM